MLLVVQMDLKHNALTKKIKIHHSSPWKKANNFKLKNSTILYPPKVPFISTELLSINGGNIENYFYSEISISYSFLSCRKWLILFQDVYKSICHFSKRFHIHGLIGSSDWPTRCDKIQYVSFLFYRCVVIGKLE